VTPISLGIFASANQSGLATSYESIAVSTVGAGGASSISFSSIPGTYSHLQIRYFARTNRATFGTDSLSITLNGVTSSSYAYHYIVGDGASVSASASASQTSAKLGDNSMGTTVVNYFGVGVIDILDYADTNKNTTIRALGGSDINGTTASYGGHVSLGSALFTSTAAITSMTFSSATGANFTQYTHFALYGIKAAS
jgi:hypothetical protein